MLPQILVATTDTDTCYFSGYVSRELGLAGCHHVFLPPCVPKESFKITAQSFSEKAQKETKIWNAERKSPNPFLQHDHFQDITNFLIFSVTFRSNKCKRTKDVKR